MKTPSKHFLLCLFFFFVTISLTGCQQGNYINDPKTGVVTVEEISLLKDGTYSAHGAFRDDEGYAPFLSFNVTKGIITKASFFEKDENGKIKSTFSQKETQKNYSEPQDLYQALEASLITHQNADNLPIENSQIADHFKKLTDTARENAQSGITTNSAVNLDLTYTVSGTTTESTPRQYKMIIVYVKGKIDSVDFTVGNSTLTDRAQIGEMTERTLKADSLSELSFTAKTSDEAALLAAYNEALTDVAAKRIPVQTP